MYATFSGVLPDQRVVLNEELALFMLSPREFSGWLLILSIDDIRVEY